VDVVQELERLTEASKAACRQKIRALAPRGFTRIGPPTRAALDMFGQAKGSKILMVMTDGEDDVLPIEIPALVAESEKAGAPIYTIGFGDLGSRAADEVLRRLAEESAGKYYFAPDAAQLAEIYRAQLREASEEFSLVYDSPFPAADGLPRSVEIEIATPRGTLAATTSYEIGGIVDAGGSRGSGKDDGASSLAEAGASVFLKTAIFVVLALALSAALWLPETSRRRAPGVGAAGPAPAAAAVLSTAPPASRAPTPSGRAAMGGAAGAGLPPPPPPPGGKRPSPPAVPAPPAPPAPAASVPPGAAAHSGQPLPSASAPAAPAAAAAGSKRVIRPVPPPPPPTG
jgi:hypothetical protein